MDKHRESGEIPMTTATATKRVWTKEEIAHHISTNDNQLCKALVLLYSMQEEDEKESQLTTKRNGVGFNSVDAPFLSSLARQAQEKGYLSPNQLHHARKAMKKYVSQLTHLANN